MAAVLDDVLRNLCSRARVLSSFIRMTEPWLFAENCHAFVHAGSFDEVKAIRDHAKALRVYTWSIGAALDAVNAAAELRIRAERRMGEALRDAEKAPAGRPPLDLIPRADRGISRPPTIAEIGITYDQSSRYQQIAAIPRATFETAVAAHKAAEEPLSAAAVMRVAETLDDLPEEERQVAEHLEISRRD